MSSAAPKPEPHGITAENRPFIMEWLRDRSAFHTWFSSIVTGSFVVLTVFGSKPGFSTVSGRFLSLALVLLLVALLCNLICVWTIPSWKYRVSTGAVTNTSKMWRELAIVGWLSLLAFVSGLTLGFVGNSGS